MISIEISAYLINPNSPFRTEYDCQQYRVLHIFNLVQAFMKSVKTIGRHTTFVLRNLMHNELPFHHRQQAKLPDWNFWPTKHLSESRVLPDFYSGVDLSNGGAS